MKATEAEKAEIPVTAEVEETVRERLETIERDKKNASPWPDCKAPDSVASLKIVIYPVCYARVAGRVFDAIGGELR